MTDTTPRPLRIIETGHGPIRVVDANGNRFCEIACAMALTAHDIVTAVNAHDDLVKALELIFHHIPLETSEQVRETAEQVGWHETYKFEAAIDFARSALAKAKGEKT